MKQTVSGNIKCYDISCSNEDIEKAMNKPIGIRCADIYLRFPEIMEEEANDLADFLEDEHIVYEGATDVFMEKDKEIERLNNIVNEYKNMKKELLDYIYHNEYCRFGHIDGSDADEMRNILNRTNKLKELKESDNNE